MMAAKINSSIEKELVERLKQGTVGTMCLMRIIHVAQYEGIANFPQNVFHNALDSLEASNHVACLPPAFPHMQRRKQMI